MNAGDVIGSEQVYCCRCGARDGRLLTPEHASCGCIPLFCDECRAYGPSQARDPKALTFAEWIASYGQVCPDPAKWGNVVHVDFASEWSAGRNPLDAKKQRAPF
jgi:hypothetical protein